MIRIFESAMRHLRQHPSESDLVLYLEGELSHAVRGRVESHCRACWSCRQHLDELHRGINDYVLHRRAATDAGPGGADFHARFLLRLAALEREQMRSSPARRPFFPLTWAAPALLGLLAVGWFALQSINAPTVSATAILRRAVLSEHSNTSASVPTGRLRLAKLERGEWSTGFLPLAPASLSVPRPAVLENLHRLLLQEDVGEFVRLSAEQFEFWAAKLKARLEARSIRVANEDYWLILARLPDRSSGLQEFSLLLRASDGVAVEEKFEFLQTGRPVSFLIRSEPLPVSPVRQASPQPLKRQPQLLPNAPAPLPAAGADVLRNARILTETAIEAEYILHDTGFDLSGTVTVQRDAHAVRVRGVVESREERERLQLAFAAHPLIQVQISILEEAILAPMPATADVSAPASLTQDQVAFRKVTDQFLRSLLAPGLDDKSAYRAIEEYGRESVRLSARAVQFAWALQRLHQRFDSKQFDLISPAHRLLLQDLSEDYEAKAHSTLEQLRTHLRLLLPPDSNRSPESASSLTELPERIDRYTRILFAGLPNDGRPLPSLLVDLSIALAGAPATMTARQNAWLGTRSITAGHRSNPSTNERQEP